MTLNAEDIMDAEQESEQSEGMTVDADSPLDRTEDTREIWGQAATTTASNVPRTVTDIAMEGSAPKQAKQNKDYKVRIGSSPYNTRRTNIIPPD